MRDEIIRMAKEAGYLPVQFTAISTLEKFAALVAAAERNRCAEVCDMVAANSVLGTANECATAIRGLK